MEVNESSIFQINEWNRPDPSEALRQIAALCENASGIDLQVSPDGSSFYPKQISKTQRQGILSIHGKFVESKIIAVHTELVRGKGDLRLSLASFIKHLSALNDKIRIVTSPQQIPDQLSLCVELRVNATPMSMVRSSAFVAEIRHLDMLAKSLQAELPIDRGDAELQERYKAFEGVLKPISPWDSNRMKDYPSFLDWAHECIDFLTGSSCIAISSPFPIVVDLALGILALAAQKSGRSLGNLLLPAINAKGLVALSKKAPGTVVVPAVRIRLGTSPYELGNEMQALLSSLSHANTPAIFSGTYEELQAIFHGGQGGAHDPLLPVVHHIPDVSLEIHTLFSIQRAGQLCGGLPQSAEKELSEKTLEALKNLRPSMQRQIIPMLANKAVNEWKIGKAINTSSLLSFAARLNGLSESLAGLSPRPRVKRSPDVQDHFADVLNEPSLLTFLKTNLLAQDKALEQLVSRLRMEVLTRPLYQPIRYCAQGTPATGKSESASLLAQRLRIPYINIDAASMPDYHTAAAQLLGSGRGIVGSHQSGRLEQAAKHHTGVVVEISDLDHAPLSVRSTLADLFLQVLETGEAQSATGAMFSCANLIFAFTMNLPQGMDEQIYKGIGFNNYPSRCEVERRVADEIKNMLSSAFLSRVGMPILFEPLDGNALSAIVERVIKISIFNAAERLHCPIQDIILEEGLGKKVIVSLQTSITSFGARALLEHGRTMAAKALSAIQQRSISLAGRSLFITASSEGTLIINHQ